MIAPDAQQRLRSAIDKFVGQTGTKGLEVLRTLAGGSACGATMRSLLITIPSAPVGITDADVRAICQARLAGFEKLQ